MNFRKEGHMMRRVQFATLLSALTTTVASAQNQESVPRAIPLPVTVGANFAVTDTLTGRSGPADYEFLLGTWRFTFHTQRRDGTFSPPFTVHRLYTRKHTGDQGALFEHHSRPDDASSTWDAGP